MPIKVSAKPGAGKAYGSIPHLPGSRMGPADHHCHEGQARIATAKKRDAKDVVSVTVKLDGSCMAVLKMGGVILPLGRAGYLASTSKFEQHRLFADWVEANRVRFLSCLSEGERLVGEWLAQAHGTRYSLRHDPFVPFDLMVGPRRFSNQQCRELAARCGLESPFVISGEGPMPIDAVAAALAMPHHGELDPVEGAVWRVERAGEFDFLCKWVRPDKVDGCYLPEVSGGEPIWNWRP